MEATFKYSSPKKSELPHTLPWFGWFGIPGVLFMGFGAITDMSAFGFAAQILLVPLGATTFVLNAILSAYFLEERLRRRDVIAFCLIIGGTIIAVIFSEHGSYEYTYAHLMYLMTGPLFLCYVIVNFMVCLVLFAMTQEAFLFSLQGFDPLAQWLSQDLRERCHRFSWPAIAGISGGGSVLLAKAVMELLKNNIIGSQSFFKMGTFVLFCSLVVTLTIQIYYLNAGLKRFDSMYVIPTYQVIWIISGILGGVFCYQEFADFTVLQGFMFPFGVILMLIGIGVLSTRAMEVTFETEPDVDPEFIRLSETENDSTNPTPTVTPKAVTPPRKRQRQMQGDLKRNPQLIDFRAPPASPPPHKQLKPKASAADQSTSTRRHHQSSSNSPSVNAGRSVARKSRRLQTVRDDHDGHNNHNLELTVIERKFARSLEKSLQ